MPAGDTHEHQQGDFASPLPGAHRAILHYVILSAPVSLDTAGAVQNTFDLRSEKALSDFDVRKRFVTWEAPSPKKGWARLILGGWQLNGMLTISSGSLRSM